MVLESITKNEVTQFVGVPDALYGGEVKAFVVLRAGFTVSAEELIGAGTAISS
jgi:acyl-coenzyme A synthetase/AMP-(fatty) acid ligase